jgi:hypothetical protein
MHPKRIMFHWLSSAARCNSSSTTLAPASGLFQENDDDAEETESPGDDPERVRGEP